MDDFISRAAAIQMVKEKPDMTPDEKAGVVARLHAIPAADVRPVVLCRDCIFRSNEWTGCPKLNGTITGDDFFCKCGIKKREES